MWDEAYKTLKKDKYITSLIVKYGECKITPRDKKHYFEDLVDSIVGQQLSVKAAAIIAKRLKEKVGGFTPDKILSTQDADLRACGLSFSKIKYVKDLAQKVKDGQLKISKLDILPDEEVMRELIAVKGIGKWTAEMFLMFTLARPDIFPVDDLGIRNSMKRLLAKDLTTDQMEKFALRWSPYRTVAAWYIWALLDNKQPLSDI